MARPSEGEGTAVEKQRVVSAIFYLITWRAVDPLTRALGAISGGVGKANALILIHYPPTRALPTVSLRSGKLVASVLYA